MEDNKVMLALVAELKEIKTKLHELSEKKKTDATAVDRTQDYVAETEQRFINLNKKLDAILVSQRNTNAGQRILVGIAMVLGSLAIFKILFDLLRAYLLNQS